MKLATSLEGGVAYGYKRTSWSEIQKWPKAREFYFLELESQKSFSHLQKMNTLRHFIIEETDLLLPDYGKGSYENFANEIKNLVENYHLNIYFNSTWKEEELSKSLQKHGLNVEKYVIPDQPLKKPKPVEQKEVSVNEPKKEVTVQPKKETAVKKQIEEKKPIVEQTVKEEKSIKQSTQKISEKVVEKVIEKKEAPKKNANQNKHSKQTHVLEPPSDLEFFYSQPKTRWQKIKHKISLLIEKIVNNF